MGFSSMDDLVNQVTTNGKKTRTDWNKVVTQVQTAGAGRWFELFTATGNPVNGYWGNYVRNSGFDSEAGWTGGGAGGWAWNIAGTYVHTGGTTGTLTQTSGTTLENGVVYTVIITTTTVSGTVGFTVSLGGGTPGTAITTATTTIQAVTAGAGQDIVITANTGITGTIDNFYVIRGAVNGRTPGFKPMSSTTDQGALWPGSVTGGTATKHLLNMSAMTSGGTVVPTTLMLVDLLGVYARIDQNYATSITLANTLTLPRYTDGAGVMAFNCVFPTVTSTGAHNMLMTYTNQDNVGSRAMPQTVAMTVSALSTHIHHSGTAANNVGPFLPLQSGDTGMKKIDTYQQTLAGGTAVFVNLVLCKPIMSIPLTTQYVLSERDLLNQFPSLPLIQESAATSGACLAWIQYAGAATPASTNFFGSLEFAWGG